MILLGMECRYKVESFFQNDNQVIILTDTRNQIVVISFNQATNLVSDCESLITNLCESYKCYVNIGIGCKRIHIEEAHLGYQEACRAVQYKVFVGNNQVVCFEDIVGNREQDITSRIQIVFSSCSSTSALVRASRQFKV